MCIMTLDDIIFRMSARQRVAYFERLVNHYNNNGRKPYRAFVRTLNSTWLISQRGIG